MNCAQYQRDILEALASGDSGPLPDEVAGHMERCAACSGFARQQNELFRAIQTGLQVAINRPVPPSLIPGIRARLDDEPVRPLPRRTLGWALPSIACAVVFVVVIAILWNSQSRNSIAIPAGQPVAVLQTGPLDPLQTGKTPVVAAAPGIERRALRSKTDVRPQKLEVIVGAEESRGLAQLVDSVSRRPELGQAFLHAAPLPTDEMRPLAAIEIAQLRMDSLADEK